MSSPSEKDIEKAREIIASTCLVITELYATEDKLDAAYREIARLKAELEQARAEGQREGLNQALLLLIDEASQLQGIMDGYFEAQKTGTHSGRRIKPETAKALSVEFRHRAEAVTLASDAIRRAMEDETK